jgi:hypothetical protein
MTKALAATVRRTTEQMRGRTLDAAIIDGHQPRQNARAGLIGGYGERGRLCRASRRLLILCPRYFLRFRFNFNPARQPLKLTGRWCYCCIRDARIEIESVHNRASVVFLPREDD